MTREQFNNLPPSVKEDYINAGGSISTAEEVSTQTSNVSSSLLIPGSILASNIPSSAVESLSSGAGLPEGKRGPSSSYPFQEEAKEPSKEGSPSFVPSSFVSSDRDILFDIRDPVELLSLLDDEIASGRTTLHDWQMQFMYDFAMGGQSDRTPFQAVVRTCNGSGKDKYIIAACVVWLAMRFKDAFGVVTSSSGQQLDRQTCRYIVHLAESANRKWGNIWRVNYRHYVCEVATDAGVFKQYIDCFATDEPGKAEGYHPTRFNSKMALFLSEDKTIPDTINVAINKCTGYTHRIHASSPGLPQGHFFDLCNIAVDRKMIKRVTDVSPESYIQYHIKASDCPHLSPAYLKQMERDLNGKDSPAYKSQIDAEFATTNEMVVVPYTYVWRCMRNKTVEWIPEEHNKAGLDLSLGLAESVLATRNGNKLLFLDCFRFDDPEDTILYLIEKFKERQLQHRESLIFGDCVGIGAPMLYSLRRKGWNNIRFFDSRASAFNKKVYKNLIAEKWFSFASLLKQNQIILPYDDILQKQLSTRYYKLSDGVIHQLLSKLEQRNKGYLSPDRADAVVYAFSDFQSTFVSAAPEMEVEKKEEEKEEELIGNFDTRLWANSNSLRGKYKVNEGQKDFSLLEGELEQYNLRRKLNKV